MPVINDHIDRSSEEFTANSEHLRALVEDLKSKLAEAAIGGGERAREKHLKRGKMLPRERIRALLDAGSPFLEIAPYLIVIMAQAYGLGEDEQTTKHYYVTESVGIATGFLIASIHNAGLVSLTHTPSPMEFLNSVLGRPANERPFLILAVGHPVEDAVVPVIRRKELHEIATFV